MLSDRARIHVQAGRGGDGCMSFRREAGVPMGGPDGGDGGRGGDVILLCDDSMRDLQFFRRSARFKAKKGGNGEGKLRHGADGDDLVIRVPPGTVVELEDGTRHDLVVPGQRAILAKGGGGARGNKHFATPTRQAPRFAEKALAGTEGWVELHLKLLADVGLVGLPNAGKSSLLSVITAAQPKIAGYPFTTLTPVLGTIQTDDRQLVIADIPGLIEGASDGAGLGHDFLAHVERTRLLVHVLDLEPIDGSDPFENHATIEQELASHDPRLASLPRILALSKSDLVTAEDAAAAEELWREQLGPDVPIVRTSSATREGLDDLKKALLQHVPVTPPVEIADIDDLAEHRVFRPARPRGFVIETLDEGVFKVIGEGVDRLVARYDVENEEAMAFLETRLRSIGVIRALDEAGFEPGDDVEIGGVVFELDPS